MTAEESKEYMAKTEVHQLFEVHLTYREAQEPVDNIFSFPTRLQISGTSFTNLIKGRIEFQMILKILNFQA